jgi:hypothetical protein
MREKELERERTKKGFFEGWEKMVETLLWERKRVTERSENDEYEKKTQKYDDFCFCFSCSFLPCVNQEEEEEAEKGIKGILVFLKRDILVW